jgi:hypothetical protein
MENYNEDKISGPGDCQTEARSSRRNGFDFNRRKELNALAVDAAEWVLRHNIRPEEFCKFNSMVKMLLTESL